MFSANVPEQMNGIAKQLQVKVAKNPRKCLGIPSFWGKSKCVTMGYIKEKILQKLKGWKRSILTQWGREVLIKAVACAIPVYTMKCFKYQRRCDEVNAMMASFWCGQKKMR